MTVTVPVDADKAECDPGRLAQDRRVPGMAVWTIIAMAAGTEQSPIG